MLCRAVGHLSVTDGETGRGWGSEGGSRLVGRDSRIGDSARVTVGRQRADDEVVCTDSYHG